MDGGGGAVSRGPAVKTIQKTKQGAARVADIDYTSFDDFGF